MRLVMTFRGGLLVLEGPSGVVATGLEAVRARLWRGGDEVFCSSGIDFPDEHTSDPAVLAYCAKIRS
jgi:hypothetical protein